MCNFILGKWPIPCGTIYWCIFWTCVCGKLEIISVIKKIILRADTVCQSCLRTNINMALQLLECDFKKI